MFKQSIQLAGQFIQNSDIIIIGAGAGIGKDSGLPDFRGNQGFWNHYPPYRGKFNFYQCANPQFLQKQPNLFWGFYGSRLQMYRKTKPHEGFNILLDLQKQHKKKLFVLTSNVDGHFHKSGYYSDQVYQIHGSIHHLQCDTCYQIFENGYQPQINYDKMSEQNIPICSKCKKTITRPNVLMFNDWNWIDQRAKIQQKNYIKFLSNNIQENTKLCLIQIGAGTAVPTIRNMLQRLYFKNKSSKFIRINPDKEDNKHTNKDRFVHLQCGALQALRNMNQVWKK